MTKTTTKTTKQVTLGERLYYLRDRAGLTQQQLATEAGVSVSAVATIEHRNKDPKWSTMVKLADALGVSLNDLRVG